MQMELTDTKELFFCYLHEVQQADFPSIKDTQKLTCTWPEYTTVILRLLGQTMREGTHFAIFTKNGSSQTGKLWFIMVPSFPAALYLLPWLVILVMQGALRAHASEGELRPGTI